MSCILTLAVLSILIAFMTTITPVQAASYECWFAHDWTEHIWMTAVEQANGGPNSNISSLMTYRVRHAFTSTSEFPNHQMDNYVCWAFQEVAGHSVYLRVKSSALRTLSGSCVEEFRHGMVLVHREYPYTYLAEYPSDSAVVKTCNRTLSGISYYNIYLPVQIDFAGSSPTWRVLADVTCPFPKLPYRVSYVMGEQGTTHCRDDSHSLLVVAGSRISIRACDNEETLDLPLTGHLSCKEVISPSALGESGKPSEGILILEGTRHTPGQPRYYCARYKQDPEGGLILLSLDVTPTGGLVCQVGSRPDWYGRHGDRDYVAMELEFDESLLPSTVSERSSPNQVTPHGNSTPSLNLRPEYPLTTPNTSDVGGHFTPVTPPVTSSAVREHIQLTVNVSLPGSTDHRDDLIGKFTSRLSEVCQIQGHRIISVDAEESETPEHTELTFNLKVGHPTVQTCADILWYLEVHESGLNVTHQDLPVTVLSETIFHWRDDSQCPEESCPGSARCRMWRGEYVCQCPESMDGSGEHCPRQAVVKDEPPLSRRPTEDYTEPPDKDSLINSTTTTGAIVAAVLIVAVVVVVVIVMVFRRRQARDKSSSSDTVSSGFDKNSSDVDSMDKERQLHNTMNRRSVAYHDKTFTDDDRDVHGEKTGIHQNGAASHM